MKKAYNVAKSYTGYNYAKKSAYSTIQKTMEARMISLWTTSIKLGLAGDPRTPWALRTMIHQVGDMVWMNIVEEIVRSFDKTIESIGDTTEAPQQKSSTPFPSPPPSPPSDRVTVATPLLLLAIFGCGCFCARLPLQL